MKKIVALHMAKNGLSLDKGTVAKWKLDDDTGFLTAPVTLARIGVQDYYGFELGLADRVLERVGVLRSADEVFKAESIESFTNLVVTDDHPDEMVNVDNVKTLQMGQVSHVEQKGDVLTGVITITDKKLIDKILGGKVEVSVGYGNNLVEMKGSTDGKEHEYAQTDIVANHLAIVDAGRCGSACKLTIDQKEVPMIKITIDGIECEVSEQAGQLFKKYSADMEKKVSDAEAKATKADEEKEEMKKEKEKAEGTADALKSKVLDDDAMAKLVNDKAVLVAIAKDILGDKYEVATKDCGTCDTKLRAAVIGHVMKDVDLSGKPDAYVEAMFDVAVTDHAKAKVANDNLGENILTDKDGKAITRDSARATYMKTLGLGGE